VSCLPTCYYTSVEFVFRKHPSMGRTQVVLPVRPPANCEAVLRFCLAHSDTSPCLVYRYAMAHQWKILSKLLMGLLNRRAS